MWTRRLMALGAMALALALLGACGGGDGDSDQVAVDATEVVDEAPEETGSEEPTLEGKTVAYMQAGPEYYYQCQGKGVELRVGELGGELKIADSQSDAQRQLANGQDLIAQSPDVLMIESTDAATGRRVVEMSQEAGIPTIIAGLPVPGAKADVELVIDYVEMGRLMGEWIVENRPGAKLGLIQGLPGQGVTEGIAEGLNEVLGESDVEIVADQPADWNRQKAGTVAQNMMSANSEIDLLYVFNEDMTVGVSQALKQSGTEVEMVSNNGSEDGMTLLEQGQISATVAQSPSNEGIIISDAAAKLVNGIDVEPIIKYPLQVVTPETVGDLEVPFCL